MENAPAGGQLQEYGSKLVKGTAVPLFVANVKFVFWGTHIPPLFAF